MTVEGAERDYGVALSIDSTSGEPVVDQERTRSLRAGAAEAPEPPAARAT